MTAAHPILKRDADGLMLDQRKLLQALAGGVEPHTACQKEGVTWSRFLGWLAKDKAFGEAFDNLGSSVGTAKALVDSMAIKATTVLGDALEAEKRVPVEVTCPEDDGGCGHQFTAYADVADMQHRKWAADRVFKSTEIVKDVQKTDVNVKHSIAPEQLERAIALARWQAGLDVPPHLVEQFLTEGIRGPDEGDVIEAESSEVPAEEATP